MKSVRLIVSLGLAALMIMAASVVGAGPARAKTSEPAIPIALAVSSATGHIFAISDTGRGQRWLTTVNAGNGAIIRTMALGPHVDSVIADDRSGHVFLVASDPVTVTVLSARTGAVISRINCGAGKWATPILATRTGQLIVGMDTGIHVINTESRRHIGHLALPISNLSIAVHDGAGRFVVSTAEGQVSIYEMRTWTVLKRLRIPGPVSNGTFLLTPVQSYPAVVLIAGKALDTLHVINVRNGNLAWSLRIPRAARIHNVVLDERLGRLYAIGSGNYDIHGTVGEPMNGAVTTIDLATHKILRTVGVGAIATWGVVDPATNHLLVTSESKLNTKGQISMQYTLVNMFDARSGTLLRSTRIPMSDIIEGALRLDSPRHRVYLYYAPSVQNNLIVVDTRNGRRLSNIPLAGNPSHASLQPHVVLAARSCNMTDLRVTASWHKVGAGLLGGGAIEGRLRFTLKGAGACTLSGPPRVRVYDARQHRLTIPQRNVPAPPGGLASVTVSSRQGATVSLAWRNWCKAATSRPLSLGVRLPDRKVFHHVTLTSGARVMASCVNPTASSVLEVGPAAPLR